MGSARRLLVALFAGLLALAACGDREVADTDNGAEDTEAASPEDNEPSSETEVGEIEANGEPIRIGIVQTLSGPLAGNGEDSVQGFELFVEQNGGQLGGHPVEIIIEDSEANPDVALRMVNKLISEDGVTAIVGFGSSASALAAVDVLESSQIPAIVTLAQANALSHDALSDFVYRTSHTYNQAGSAAGRYVAESVASEDVRILTWDFVGGNDVAAAFSGAYQEAGGTGLSETFTPFPATGDFQPYLSDIVNADLEAVYAFYGGGDSIDLVTQYANFGLQENGPTLVGFPSLTDESVQEAQGDAAEGVLTVAPYTWTLENETNELFVEAYESAYGEVPTDFAVYSWDAGQLLDQALSGLDALSGEALAEALDQISQLDSPRGMIEMNPETNNPDQPFYVREVTDYEGGLANVVIEELGMIAEPSTTQ